MNVSKMLTDILKSPPDEPVKHLDPACPREWAIVPRVGWGRWAVYTNGGVDDLPYEPSHTSDLLAVYERVDDTDILHRVWARPALYKGAVYVLDREGIYENEEEGDEIRVCDADGFVQTLDPDDPQEWALPPERSYSGVLPPSGWTHWRVYTDGSHHAPVDPNDGDPATLAQYERVTIHGVDLLHRTWLRPEAGPTIVFQTAPRPIEVLGTDDDGDHTVVLHYCVTILVDASLETFHPLTEDGYVLGDPQPVTQGLADELKRLFE